MKTKMFLDLNGMRVAYGDAAFSFESGDSVRRISRRKIKWVRAGKFERIMETDGRQFFAMKEAPHGD